MIEKRVTLRDVAAAAGVSRATAGFVLSDVPGITISEPTRKRVRQTAAADEALAVTDAAAALTGYIRACVALRTGALAPLAGTIEATPQMWEMSRQGRRLHQAIVDRAHRDGHLRPDVTALDISWLIEQFGRSAPPAGASGDDRSVQQRLLAIAIDGLFATGAPPLPEDPPTAHHYEQRWQLDLGARAYPLIVPGSAAALVVAFEGPGGRRSSCLPSPAADLVAGAAHGLLCCMYNQIRSDSMYP